MVAREDLLQQDRQRPAIEHDVVIGQHKPVPLIAGKDQCPTERQLVGQIADRRTFGGAYSRNLLVDIGFAGEIERLPGHCRIGRDDLHRLVEPIVKPGYRVRVSGYHVMHRISNRPASSGPANVMSSCMA